MFLYLGMAGITIFYHLDFLFILAYANSQSFNNLMHLGYANSELIDFILLMMAILSSI